MSEQGFFFLNFLCQAHEILSSMITVLCEELYYVTTINVDTLEIKYHTQSLYDPLAMVRSLANNST